MSRYPEYIEPEELRDLLLQARAGDSQSPKIQIIDVRDGDFGGGKIPGAINVPSEEWHDEDMIDSLVAEHKDKKLIVFHCMLSQQRGPFTASRFLSRLSHLEGDGGAELPRVAVLRGGIRVWKQLYEEEGLVVPCRDAPPNDAATGK